MREQELAAIKARAEAASPGPWGVHHLERGPMMIGIDTDPDGGGPVDLAIAEMLTDATHGDADFIARARTDVPALLAEVERLKAALDEEMDKGQAMKIAIERLREALDRVERERDEWRKAARQATVNADASADQGEAR